MYRVSKDREITAILGERPSVAVALVKKKKIKTEV
jgi:hypothetical protein